MRLHWPRPLRWRFFSRAWLKAAWDRYSIVILVVIVVVGAILFVNQAHETNGFAKTASTASQTAASDGKTIKRLTREEIRENNQHHAESQQQQTELQNGETAIAFLGQEIVNNETAIKTLLAGHTTDLGTISQLEQQNEGLLTALGPLAEYLIKSNEAVCASTSASCPAPPG